MANSLNQTKYGDHLRGCVDLANEMADRLNIHDDNARQACFATVIINAERHNLFMEPHPPHSKTPVIQPETAAVELSASKSVETTAAEKDQRAAEKADAQILDVPRRTTPEQENGARRTAFLKGIESARDLLNKEGHVPVITPKALNAVICHDFAPKTMLSTLDVDELERLMMFLNSKLEVLREQKRKSHSTADDDIGF